MPPAPWAIWGALEPVQRIDSSNWVDKRRQEAQRWAHVRVHKRKAGLPPHPPLFPKSKLFKQNARPSVRGRQAIAMQHVPAY